MMAPALSLAMSLALTWGAGAALAQSGQQPNTFSPPALRGLDQNNSASVTEPAGSAAQPGAVQPDAAQSGAAQSGTAGSAGSPSYSVESFFQIAPPAPFDKQAQAKPHGRAYNVIWHTMDNIGVPMFGKFGNHDPDIDPALTRPFVMPPLATPSPAPGSAAAAARGGASTHNKPTIIDPEAEAKDPSQMTPDDMSKASSTSHSTSNPQ